MTLAVGKPHVAMRDLEVRVLDYDSLGENTETLAAGSTFQPWAPEPHWHGDKVPITLGEGATCFDWGVSSFEGRFLAWADFFEHCQPIADR